MLRRLQSLQLPMTHINHWWSLYTAYECVMMMMILPLYCILPTTVTQTEARVSHKLLTPLFLLPSPFSHFYASHIIILSAHTDHNQPDLASNIHRQFILSCSRPLSSSPCWPWTCPCQAESRWLKVKGYTHYTD